MTNGHHSETHQFASVSIRAGRPPEHRAVTTDEAGCHVRFAFQVTTLPAYDGRAMILGKSHRQWALGLLAEQANFLVALRSAHDRAGPARPTLQLRLSTVGLGDVQIMLIGKVTHVSERRALWMADELISEIRAAFPGEIGLSLLPCHRLDAALSQPFDPTAGEWWGCEVRRRMEHLLTDGSETTTEGLILPLPFGCSANGTIPVARVMATRREAATLAVTLRATALTAEERDYLQRLCGSLNRQWMRGGTVLPLAPGVWEAACNGVFRSLTRPFEMRVQLAGVGASGPLVGAVARAVSGIPGGYFERRHCDPAATAAYCAGIETVFPRGEDHEDWETYRNNLLHLDLRRWADDSDTLERRRLRYLTDAAGATSLFHVPLLPPELADDVGLQIGET